jgi:microcystin-dependent protein
MVDQFLGEIKLVGFNFPPIDWATCAGQIVSITQNPSLFALLGTMYGGNGTTNFGLPDLQGRAAGHVGPNLYTAQGEKLGTETVSLNLTEYPLHSHALNVGTAGTVPGPLGNFLSSVAPVSGPPTAGLQIYTPASGANVQPLNNGIIGQSAGGSQPHENMMPFLAMNYIIALQGVFPARG